MVLRNDSGNTSTVLALIAVPLVVAAGSAIDYASALRHESRLQAVVDASALAAVAAGKNKWKEAATTAYQNQLELDGCDDTPDVKSPGNEVTVRATCSVKTSFMGVAGYQSIEIAATATALRGRTSGSCLISLHNNDKEALMINSDSAVVAPNRDIQINSTNTEAVRGNSNGDVTTREFCATGGWTADGSSNFSPSPVKCPVLADPLALLPVPPTADDSCDKTDYKVTGTATLNPGVYCKKLEIDAKAKVTFNPGIYVVRDGEFIVNSESSVTGDGVMIYLTGDNNARFNINSGSHIELKAPRTGTYAGVAIFQQRNSTADFSILNSDSSSFIVGVIYLPDTALHLNSKGSLSPSAPWTVVIADKVEVNSLSTLRLNANYDASDVPLPSLYKTAMQIGVVRLTK